MPKLTDVALLPFYGLTCLHFLDLHTSGFWQHFTAIPVLLKTAPIWYLFVYSRYMNTPTKAKTPTAKRELSPVTDNSYKNYITFGLAVSSIGDMIMEHQSGLIPGGFVFGIAHILYALGFRKRGTKSKYAWLVLPITSLFMYTIIQKASPIEYKVFAFLYNVMISATMMSAVACHEDNRTSRTLFAAIGASVFFVSDYLIGYSTFIAPIPHSDTLIMTTYYSAQLLIALSVNH